MEIKRIVVGALQANCYLLIDGGDLAVIDPGDDARKIIDEIKKTEAKVKFIANTHYHFDHSGANDAVAREFGVPILSGLKDGDVLEIGTSELKVVQTPGHASESLCFFGDNFVISGDTLFEDGIGRTDLPGGSDEQMIASLKRLEALIPEGTVVYPGHGNRFQYKRQSVLI